MSISWRNRLKQQPGLRKFSEWPTIPLETIPTLLRAQFVRNQKIVAAVLQDASFKSIAKKHNVSIGRISQLMDRCLGGEESSDPSLMQGIIPNKVVVDKKRIKPLPTLNDERGNVCAFSSLLNTIPGLKEGLDNVIKSKIDDEPEAQRLTPEALHGTFKQLLAEAHWPRDKYPYTTKSLAYASVRRYLEKRWDELLVEKKVRKKSSRRRYKQKRKFFRALRAIQIDEHTHDLTSQIHLLLNDDLIPLRIARASVLVSIDVDSSCVLGYYLAPTSDANQQDILSLADNCIQPWRPLDLMTPGLTYSPGACFPSGLENSFPISFGTVQMDNAMVHRANSVKNLFCTQMGATLSLGHPAMPTVREKVEYVFNYINKKFSHRVASTTGSHPNDPKKESKKNRKNTPVITFQTINEILSVVLTEYNITPRPELGHASPLELFKYHCENHFVRFIPNSIKSQWQPHISTQKCKVHWYKHENRMPFINFCYERYYGPQLVNVLGKVKSAYILIQFDRRDIRQLRAFSLDGKDLGTLHVSAPWQRYPHSVATRQHIKKLSKIYGFNVRDPLADYFRFLLEQKNKPAKALTLLRVYDEFSMGFSSSISIHKIDEAPEELSVLTKKSSHFKWDSDLAYRKR